MDDDTLRSLIEQACDPKTDNGTRLNTQRLIAKKYPELFDRILTGKLQEVVEAPLFQPVTQPKPEVVVKHMEVPPKGYDTVCKNSRRFLKLLAGRLSMDMAYEDRFTAIIDLEVGVEALGDNMDDYICPKKLAELKKDPVNPKANLARRVYDRIKNMGQDGSTIDRVA